MKLLNLKINVYLILAGLLVFTGTTSCSDETRNAYSSGKERDSSKQPVLAPKMDYVTEEQEAIGYRSMDKKKVGNSAYYNGTTGQDVSSPDFNTESYDMVVENNFISPLDEPLSTFSIDVDNASYTNTRRFLNQGTLPPKDAVRIEEFINYFSYDYDQPKDNHPFSVYTEVSECPWNKNNKIIHIGLQGKKYDFEELPNSNLVFLIDVSGSMSQANKLPLLKNSFDQMVNKLRPQDRVAIVVYAGAAGEVLSSTSGNEKKKIRESLSKLEAGGSTAGGEGLKLAYKIAEENFIEGGINRIMLATDGDFNVGPSSNAEMTRLVEEKREKGIEITVLGFGMGNYKDSKMESIADQGNGNYFYIDNIREAQKVLVDQLDATLYTIAKDVKLQLEFNPKYVGKYRLIGYENRMLKKEDFNNDKKDAGELGAGHTVTAIYEIMPASEDQTREVDPLKYQKQKISDEANNPEILTLKLRYKPRGESKSNLIANTLMASEETSFDESSEKMRFSASVAAFGMQLRDSEYKGDINYEKIISWSVGSRGKDEDGLRSEFVQLVKSARGLAQ